MLVEMPTIMECLYGLLNNLPAKHSDFGMNVKDAVREVYLDLIPLMRGKLFPKFRFDGILIYDNFALTGVQPKQLYRSTM